MVTDTSAPVQASMVSPLAEGANSEEILASIQAQVLAQTSAPEVAAGAEASIWEQMVQGAAAHQAGNKEAEEEAAPSGTGGPSGAVEARLQGLEDRLEEVVEEKEATQRALRDTSAFDLLKLSLAGSLDAEVALRFHTWRLEAIGGGEAMEKLQEELNAARETLEDSVPAASHAEVEEELLQAQEAGTLLRT